MIKLLIRLVINAIALWLAALIVDGIELDGNVLQILFVALIFGLINAITWFGLVPSGWWMGVLHIPLLAISVYAFGLAQHRDRGQPGPASR